jgi:hypothetical protein
VLGFFNPSRGRVSGKGESVRGEDCKKSSPGSPPYTGDGSLRKYSPPTSRFDKGHVHDLVDDELDVVVDVVVHRGVIDPAGEALPDRLAHQPEPLRPTASRRRG